MSSFSVVPVGWEIKEIKDAGLSVIDGDRGKQYPNKSEFSSTGFCLFLNTGNIKGDSFDFSNCDFITEQKDSLLRKGKLHRSDIVLTTRGTVGSVAYYGESIPFKNVRINSGMVIIRTKPNLDPCYLYYLLKSPISKTQYSLFASGSAQPQLPIKDLRRIKLPFPPVKVQRKIAAILTAYDDLIEVNKRRIALLEKMAEEVYREWFVRLRFPGYQNTRFVKGVPEVWNIYKFSDICKFTKGRTPTQLADAPLDDHMPYVNAAYLRGQPPEYAKRDRQSVLCESGDVLMLMDGSNSGLVFRALPGIVASTFARIKTDKKYQNFIFEYLKASQESIVSNNTGSAVPHANKEFIDRLIIFVPQEDQLLADFNEHYHAIHSQRTTLYKQNEILTKTRDLLLPRLISGKLSVEDLDIRFPPSMLGEADGDDGQAA